MLISRSLSKKWARPTTYCGGAIASNTACCDIFEHLDWLRGGSVRASKASPRSATFRLYQQQASSVRNASRRAASAQIIILARLFTCAIRVIRLKSGEDARSRMTDRAASDRPDAVRNNGPSIPASHTPERRDGRLTPPWSAAHHAVNSRRAAQAPEASLAQPYQ